MRKLSSFELHGDSVGDVLAQFNDQAAGMGITSEDQVVSVSELEPLRDARVASLAGGHAPPKVRLLIVYWANP